MDITSNSPQFLNIKNKTAILAGSSIEANRGYSFLPFLGSNLPACPGSLSLLLLWSSQPISLCSSWPYLWVSKLLFPVHSLWSQKATVQLNFQPELWNLSHWVRYWPSPGNVVHSSSHVRESRKSRFFHQFVFGSPW